MLLWAEGSTVQHGRCWDPVCKSRGGWAGDEVGWGQCLLQGQLPLLPVPGPCVGPLWKGS